MSWLKKLLRALLSIGVGTGVYFGGAPPEFAGIVAGGVAVALEPTPRSRSAVVADEANRAERAAAFEGFGGGIIIAWQAAGLLLTFRPKVFGYLHGLLALMRAQKRFEDQVAATTAALSSVLLYGSTETQEAAIALFKVFGEKLKEVGESGTDASPRVRKIYEEVSLELGGKMVAWRRAAQLDLTIAEDPSKFRKRGA
jgi:hypothetical protein